MFRVCGCRSLGLSVEDGGFVVWNGPSVATHIFGVWGFTTRSCIATNAWNKPLIGCHLFKLLLVAIFWRSPCPRNKSVTTSEVVFVAMKNDNMRSEVDVKLNDFGRRKFISEFRGVRVLHRVKKFAKLVGIWSILALWFHHAVLQSEKLEVWWSGFGIKISCSWVRKQHFFCMFCVLCFVPFFPLSFGFEGSRFIVLGLEFKV